MKKLLSFVICCMLLCNIGCQSHEEHEEEKYNLLVTHPQKKDVVVEKEYVCQIHSSQHIEIQALEKGYLKEIYIDEGQLVKKGDPLFQIMPNLYQAEFDKAKAEYDYAKIEYQNTERLRKSDIVAVSELNMAKATLDKAKAELELAQVHLDFTSINAPFSGLTGKLEVRKGSLLEEGHLLTTLSDNHKMWVYFNVPEAEYLEFENLEDQQETSIQLKLANQNLYSESGTITAIESDFNNETGNISFRGTFLNPDNLLRHGQTGNILLKTPIKDALIIPQKATFEILDKRYVFVVNKDNIIESRKIDIISEIPNRFIIDKGLSDKDSILIEGLRKVRDGDSIEPNFKSPDEVFKNLKVYAE